MLDSAHQHSAPKVAADEERAAVDGLSEIARALRAKPFRPHPLFRNGHAQTLAGHVWPRRFHPREVADEARLFEVEPGIRLLGHCRWQSGRDAVRRAHPTIVLVHGLEGSSESVYMLGTAQKAYRAGFNVLRMNMRNCGGTEHLASTLYNSGMSGDFRTIVQELIEQDRLPSIFLVGFSMGGNIVLKLAGEDGGEAPRELKGVGAVSPSLDLNACANQIERRANWLYRRRFVSSLHRRMRSKEKLYPHLYNTRELRRVRTIRDFDEHYTSPHGGYKNASDYYERASALPLVARIRKPTLILHAQDDPFIPIASFRNSSITDNPHVVLIAPPHGGHVGFIGGDSKSGEDRFWAENRVIEFCRLVHKS